MDAQADATVTKEREKRSSPMWLGAIYDALGLTDAWSQANRDKLTTARIAHEMTKAETSDPELG